MLRSSCLVIMLLLVTVSILSAEPGMPARANVNHVPKHLPEAPEFARDEPWFLQLLWAGATSVVALVVFCLGHDLYMNLKAWFNGGPKTTDWIAVGQWVDPDHGVVLFAMRAPHEPWQLAVKEDGFQLVIVAMDPIKGTARGLVTCAGAGHTVGSWTIEPGAENPNRLALHFKLGDHEDVVFVLRKAG